MCLIEVGRRWTLAIATISLLNLERGLIVYKIRLLNVMIHYPWHSFIGRVTQGNPSFLGGDAMAQIWRRETLGRNSIE